MRGAHSIYFDRLVPRIGAALSDASAYAYLPQSTVYLPERAELRAMLERAGFEGIERRGLLLGAAQILTARRAQ